MSYLYIAQFQDYALSAEVWAQLSEAAGHPQKENRTPYWECVFPLSVPLYAKSSPPQTLLMAIVLL